MIHEFKPLPVYQMPEERTSPLFARAFAQGCGGVVKNRYAPGPWAGFGSPQNWHEMQQSIRDGYDWYFGDHAYFRRGQFYRVTKNAFFHDGAGVSDMQRVKMFFGRLEPWRRTGSNIILCPQSETFFRREGTTQAAWLAQVTEELRQHTDRKIIVHHKRDTKPLWSLFKSAYCVISYSSNSAVEAVMAGVPAINTAYSHAALMTRRSVADINNLYYPDNRLEWAAVLADNQWTLEEISNGDCWRKLNAEV